MSEPPINSSTPTGADRRGSKRRPIQLVATIDYRGEPGLPCEIADFCAEGVFVSLSEIASQKLNKLQFGPGEVVQLTFHDPFVNRDHILGVQAVRTLSNAFGGMFTSGNAAAITALLRICGAENLKTSQKQVQPETAALLMRQCTRIIQTHLSPLVSAFITALPKLFNESVKSAATDNQKSELIDATMSLRQQSGLLMPQLFKHISEALVPKLQQNEGAGGANSGPDLSLIDKAEFEDWLTLKVMVTRAETNYRSHLLQLKMRFDALGVSCQKGYSNPVGPALICYAFRDTLMAMNLPLSAERLCLKQFEQSVMMELEVMYKELDELLIHQGVLPDLDLAKYIKTPEQTDKVKEQESVVDVNARKKNEHAQAKPAKVGQTKSVEDSTGKQKDDTANDAAHTLHPKTFRQERHMGEMSSLLATAEESVAAVNRLLDVLHLKPRVPGPGSLPATPFPDPEEAPSFRNEEVLENLSQVQTVPVSHDENSIDGSSLKERLYQLMNSHHMDLKSFTREQDKSLDVVDRFFISLLKNPKLTSITKMQIKSLEVPVLRMLMRNPAFFTQTDNPAKQLINRIAQVGVKGGRVNAAQVERINRMVSRIQEEHEQDPSVFDEALAEMDELVERQNVLYRKNVERVTAGAEGQQKVEESRIAVTEALRHRVFGRRVPKAIATLINGGWRDLLSLIYIRQGPESQAWQDYLSVLDTLLLVARDPDTPYNLPDLLRLIQEGLATISSNHMPSGHVRDELRRFLVKEPGSEPEMFEFPEELDEETVQDVGLIQDARQRGLQRWLNRAQKLKVGDWLRLERQAGDSEFIRLVWIGKNFTRYVFVNHQGMKVIDLDANTLAAYLQKGIAVPDDGVALPVVDQSLDMMVKDLYEQLSFASTHDELTGLMLRKEFERQVLVKHSNLSSDDTISCILLSLAQFRLLNDSAGTEAGDEVLKGVARLLEENTPESALVARFAGDEFMVVINGPVADWVKNIMDQVSRFRLHWKESTFEAALYVGYVEIKGGLLDVRHMVQAAEDACRSAKRKGAGTVEVYNVDQQQIAQRDAIAHKVANLGKKLDDERLLLRCQKIIPLTSESTVGTQHEILLSIYDDEGQLIPAGKFIRAAESYKRMQEVDRWVVGHMLDWMVANQRKISQIGGLSINLSGHSLNDESLLEFIFERLTKQESPMEKITFELTEASAISNLHNISDFIRELQEYGCRFCLGNYGSGVATYQYLKQLPVDMIKIDGSFIQDLEKDKNDQMMVKSMTEMAHYLNREVIAPQVETKEAFELVKALGADYAQGYFIERPKSLANLWATLD